ncbi:1,2-dihydroxy-3-keto-5-methylthiopentene dioxygenase [Pseudomonas saudiphocaensis]|uniref:1,2-dihydroxy-3-keto-5-methylthiopentene dioxygenase n=1 Tax=Pseudomonas saudiphocaensis TaxID=1499686 RepID=UPI00187D5F2B|nr:acireductone dioxygenase [Pseudomonas saudiphocaensis]MBE7926789.1 acireductone dioxygenase [Pseudomonas saudiphocaensis]
MSILSVYHHETPEQPFKVLTHHDDVAATLAEVGVHLERWQAGTAIAANADDGDLLAAYRAQIDRLKSERGYAEVEVLRLAGDQSKQAASRVQELEEYVQAEDEARFFVAGRGLFNLHIEDRIFALLCEKGDLLVIPAAVRHWFDKGENPYLIAICLFKTTEGRIPQFTGEDIASRFPRLDD